MEGNSGVREFEPAIFALSSNFCGQMKVGLFWYVDIILSLGYFDFWSENILQPSDKGNPMYICLYVFAREG